LKTYFLIKSSSKSCVSRLHPYEFPWSHLQHLVVSISGWGTLVDIQDLSVDVFTI
jgi:hypothetical protein